MTDKRKLDEWVDDYGEDSDFVKVRVRGEFPSASSMQFIPSDIVEAAQEREAKSYSHWSKCKYSFLTQLFEIVY